MTYCAEKTNRKILPGYAGCNFSRRIK